MKKTLYILGAAAIVLSSTLAFSAKTENLKVTSEPTTASANKSEGFALQDQDQWK
ncbi:MAG: hypothetical protein MUF39_10080 [Cyclobacteriaceae bacterium]|jgi:hypothetical protein|nr:hypothetical protein [Cyclobacteriaceae bacterium]